MSDNCPKMPDWIEFHNDVAAAHQSGYEEGAMDLAAMKERAEKAEAAECGNGPCGDALDALWDDIILAHKPNYGEWEYPGMAARHITAAFYDLRADNARLRGWVNDLQSGMYINCVYCGHRFGPEDEVPATMAEALKEHVEKCPEHPMSALKADNVRLREVLADAQDYICSGITDAPAHAKLMDEINALLDDTEQAAREQENDDER